MISNTSKILGVSSLVLGLINFILIINFIFQLTPFQYLEGMPVLVPVVSAPILVLIAAISFRKTRDRVSKVSIIFNGVLFLIPFLYMYGGTLQFGV